MKATMFLCIVVQLCWGRVVVAQTDTTLRLDAGAVQLDVYISRTAHMFHVVDQIAGWSEFCHRQYVSYFEGLEGGLSEKDRELLGQHRGIRKVHGWGQGLEQTFYTSEDLDSALELGVKEGHLTKEEAATERRVFMHFEGRIERLMAE